MTALPDAALVVRGGQNLPAHFAQGSGVTVDAGRRMQGVSINAAGGEVVPAPTRTNPYHATLSGLTPEQASQLFRPTQKNPNPRLRIAE